MQESETHRTPREEFDPADMAAYLPLIAHFGDLSQIASAQGLLALEGIAGQEENEFLKDGLSLIIDAHTPDDAAARLTAKIVIGGYTGAALLAVEIIRMGILCVQAGANPADIGRQLTSLVTETACELAALALADRLTAMHDNIDRAVRFYAFAAGHGSVRGQAGFNEMRAYFDNNTESD